MKSVSELSLKHTQAQPNILGLEITEDSGATALFMVDTVRKANIITVTVTVRGQLSSVNLQHQK